MNIELAGSIVFFTDSEITKNTYLKGKLRARLANNVGLWIQPFDNMPSHTDTDHKKLAQKTNLVEAVAYR